MTEELPAGAAVLHPSPSSGEGCQCQNPQGLPPGWTIWVYFEYQVTRLIPRRVAPMSEHIQTGPLNTPNTPPSEFSWQSPPLPPWLARRLLREDETVTWVRGPRFNPSWERYVTHPVLFLLALVISAAC